MAFFDTDVFADRLRLRDLVARLFDTPFDRRARHVAARIRDLRALSDAELAQRGIARDAIPALVLSGQIR